MHEYSMHSVIYLIPTLTFIKRAAEVGNGGYPLTGCTRRVGREREPIERETRTMGEGAEWHATTTQNARREREETIAHPSNDRWR